jgi:hypothetical protein
VNDGDFFCIFFISFFLISFKRELWMGSGREVFLDLALFFQ